MWLEDVSIWVNMSLKLSRKSDLTLSRVIPKCFQKLLQILENLACNFFQKRDSDTGVPHEICEICENTFLAEHLRSTAS